jgi:hypothetical protein
MMYSAKMMYVMMHADSSRVWRVMKRRGLEQGYAWEHDKEGR